VACIAIIDPHHPLYGQCFDLSPLDTAPRPGWVSVVLADGRRRWVPRAAQARHDLLEILEERYGRRSTIVTSQLPVENWHAVIGNPTYADAILDRLVHNAQRLNLSGDSLRRTREKPPQKS